MSQSLGEKVKSLRGLKRVTQEELAVAVGISRNYVFKIESREAIPSMKTLSTIASYFGVSVGSLIDGEEVIIALRTKADHFSSGISELKKAIG